MDDRPVSFLTAVRRHTRLADVPALSAVPAVLVVFTLPVATKERLALAYADPSVLSIYAMHFVHFRLAHLPTNLASYVIIVSVVFSLCALSGCSLYADLSELSLDGFVRALDPAGYLKLAAFALIILVLFPAAA